MQFNRMSMCNKQIQNYILSDTILLITNLIKDKYKYQIKYKHHILHMKMSTPK